MLKIARVLLGSLLAVFALAPLAGAQAPASCQTFDASNQPATLFSSDDQVIVSGQGFPTDVRLRLDFLQATLVPQLTTLRTNETGGFATDPLALPADAYGGSASIRAVAGGVTATCAIEMVPKVIEAKPVDGPIVVAWVSVLVLGALVLVVVMWRRWRANRRAAKLEQRHPISLLMPRESSAPEAFVYVEEEEARRDEPPVLAHVGAPTGNVSDTVARLMEATKTWNER
jgi:hypothetical protein